MSTPATRIVDLTLSLVIIIVGGHIIYSPLNTDKTNYILFNCKENMNIQINKNNIKRVTNIKFLGVIIDNKLSWKYHISYLRAKLKIGQM